MKSYDRRISCILCRTSNALTLHTLPKTTVCVASMDLCECNMYSSGMTVMKSGDIFQDLQSSESLHQGRAAWAVPKAKNAVCRLDITSWFPGLQLSVFVFLSIVVSSLGLLGQLSAVLGLFVLVSSALRVRWPEGSLLLGIGAGTEYTYTRARAHTHTHRSRLLAFSFVRPNVNNLQHINTHASFCLCYKEEWSSHPIGWGRLRLGFGSFIGTA